MCSTIFLYELQQQLSAKQIGSRNNVITFEVLQTISPQIACFAEKQIVHSF